ncbi:hypothetical protein SEVIR_9G397300v4 [Setaria viridis]|uniref:Uncharacterized protein n=1 Tax=Setaria viridis TaxID=4556 RepID=A0A4U6TFD4_SETVI|nr:hypothetical protein SEVIR_9G397300v2 [Setaria viridis]
MRTLRQKIHCWAFLLFFLACPAEAHLGRAWLPAAALPDGGAPPRSPPPLPAAVPLSWAPPLPAEREELRAATAATAREIPLLVTLSFSEDGAQARTAHASSRRGRC